MSPQRRIEKASERVAAAIEARDDALVEESDAGATLRELAEWSGLNHETVRTIIRRRKRFSTEDVHVVENRMIAWTDGGGGVPLGSEAYIGVVVQDEQTQEVLLEYGAAVGRVSHNAAEYLAVLEAIRFAVEHGATHLRVRSDSGIAVGQINGTTRVTKPHLAELLAKVHAAVEGLDFQIVWVSRKENLIADKLTRVVREVAGKETTDAS